MDLAVGPRRGKRSFALSVFGMTRPILILEDDAQNGGDHVDSQPLAGDRGEQVLRPIRR